MVDAQVTTLLDELLVPLLGHGPAKWPRRVYERVAHLAAEARVPPLALLGQVLRGRDPELVEQIVDAATIGHTGFFRHPEQFEELRLVLPQLFASKQEPLRLWCAACSTGEEAYSLALTAQECQVPVEILATDVNAVALRAAREGCYPAPRSARPEWPGSGNAWNAPESLKQLISFRVASLADAPPSTGKGPFDLVFCRNALIYFEREDVPTLLRALASSLAQRAALVVSPADAVLPIPEFLRHSQAPGWLKPAGSSSLRPRPRKGPLPIPSLPTRGALARPRSLRPKPRPVSVIESAAQLLSSGKAPDAEQLLTQLLNREANCTAAWFLLGEALVQRGENSQARAAFVRAGHTLPQPGEDIQAEALRLAAKRRAQGLH